MNWHLSAQRVNCDIWWALKKKEKIHPHCRMIWWHYTEISLIWLIYSDLSEPWQRQLWPGSPWWACSASGTWPGTWWVQTRWKTIPTGLLLADFPSRSPLTSFSSWRTIRASTTSATTALTSGLRRWTNWLRTEWSWRVITSSPSAPRPAASSSPAGKVLVLGPETGWMFSILLSVYWCKTEMHASAEFLPDLLLKKRIN